jgi:hypothetical protein
MRRQWIATSVISLGIVLVAGGCIFATDPGKLDESQGGVSQMDGGDASGPDAATGDAGSDAEARDTTPGDTEGDAIEESDADAEGGADAGPRCEDGVHNGRETDVDCGGPDCAPCGAEKKCQENGDCASGVCGDDKECAEPSCEDGVQNQDESDIDCGGSECDGCSVGKTCGEASDCQTSHCIEGTCVHGIQGSRTEDDPGRWSDDTSAESCAAYRRPESSSYAYEGSTGDGKYEIKPSSGADSIVVTCDMTTDGGGWTRIRRCVARENLDGTLQTRGDDSPDTKGVDRNCRPYSRHTGSLRQERRHTAIYTFEFPPGFSEFRLDGFTIRANTGSRLGGGSSESAINPGVAIDQWFAYGPGDVAFGDGKKSGPETSFARVLSNRRSCSACEISWPSSAQTSFDLQSSTTRFRIGWREESEGAAEGWYGWSDGYIYLR